MEIRHIGLMIESLSGYGSPILKGISRYAQQKNDWRIAFFDRERRELADLLASWEGDGIICTAVDQRFGDAALGRKIPVVNVAALIDEPKLLTVIGDDHAAGRMGAEFFLDRGFQNFGFIRRRDSSRYAKNRSDGFSDRLAENGFKAESISLSQGNADSELVEWIGSLPRPLALLGAIDRLGATALEACWKLDLKVPEEVAVLGIGNHEQMCELCSPNLSSVHLDMERRGYEAAALLDRTLNNEPRPEEAILIQPAHVVERHSTDIFAFEDDDLVSALRFIRDGATKTIRVSDVVAVTKLSRRSLEGRFAKHLDRTIHEEIWRSHFDLAQRMLTSSDLGLQEVAERSGFRTASSLINLFGKHKGMTPKEYRIANRR
ncbi:MAG: LacI family transcriptional regulator [Verrucomicrobiales bacterium]|jgi:LacI family transcriptional regulator